MKAVVIEAEWAPRPGTPISDEDVVRRWAPNAHLVYRHPRVFLDDVPAPGEPGPGEVLVKIANCGMCGSDLHMYESDEDGYIILPYHLKAPVVLGHEFSGTIAAVGKGVRDFQVGDIVAVEEIQYCGECHACRGGMPNSCARIEDFGFTINGGYAEYVIAPTRACWSLNPLLDRYSREAALEVGALCEPTSVAYEGMFTRAGGFKPGGAVAVFGAGPIGLASIAHAAAAGAWAVIAFETVPERQELARGIGATHVFDPTEVRPSDVVGDITRGIGVAMAVEASGAWTRVMSELDLCLAVGGKAAIVGMGPTPPTVNLVEYQLRGASLYGSVGHCGGWNYGNVINLMASGRIHMERAITHRFGLDGFVAALESLRSRTQGKVLVHPE